MSRIFGWLGSGIVVCAGRAPPKRGTSPALHFSPVTWFEIFRVRLPTRDDGALIRHTPPPGFRPRIPGPGHAFVPMTGRAGGNDRTVDYPVAKRASELGRGAERPPNFAQTGTPAVEQEEGAEYA